MIRAAGPLNRGGNAVLIIYKKKHKWFQNYFFLFEMLMQINWIGQSNNNSQGLVGKVVDDGGVCYNKLKARRTEQKRNQQTKKKTFATEK